MNKLYFLDYQGYPNAKKALDILSENFDVYTLTLNEQDHFDYLISELDNPGVFYYTLDPTNIKLLQDVGYSSKSLISDILTEEELKQLKREVNIDHSELVLKRLKLTFEDIDPLSLMNIFNESPDLTVKIQTKQKPIFYKYNGLDTIRYFMEFKSGMVTPALEEEASKGYLKTEYIVQAMNGKYKMFIVKNIGNVTINWFEVEEAPIPEDILEVISKYPKGCFFFYLKKLKDFKISTIYSGINYHVDPTAYLYDIMENKEEINSTVTEEDLSLMDQFLEEHTVVVTPEDFQEDLIEIAEEEPKRRKRKKAAAELLDEYESGEVLLCEVWKSNPDIIEDVIEVEETIEETKDE